MTRAQEAPVEILEIFDQKYKKTPKEWDLLKKFDQNWSDIYIQIIFTS